MATKGVIFSGFLLFSFLVSCSNAAVRVDAKRRVEETRAKRHAEFTKRSAEGDDPKLDELLGLTPGEKVVNQNTVTIRSSERVSFTETYQNIEVYDTRISAKKDGNGSPTEDVSGIFLQNIEEDIPDMEIKISDNEAFRIAKAHNNDDNDSDEVHLVGKIKTQVYQHPSNGIAYLTKFVRYTALSETKKKQVRVMETVVDAKTGAVLRTLDVTTSCAHAAKYETIGGNLKVGQFRYNDIDFDKLTIKKQGNNCTFENQHVRVVNLNHNTISDGSPFTFDCQVGFNDSINGAYSPLADALAFGEVIDKMYLEWYNKSALTHKLIMRVHYSHNYENAFWDGQQMTFGDGRSTFYPLVSLDVSAHEVSHGFTNQNSDLIYAGQSGGMNEAFSDMAGEAAKYYMKGSNDWLLGYDIFKANRPLRWMNNPPLDGNSIDHVDNYYDGMDVHYSSGVFNKAFYYLTTTTGWNTRKAFDIMVLANQMYWHPSSTFEEGACGAMKAAKDLGYKEEDVRAAFIKVGLAGCVDMSDVIELLPGTPFQVQCAGDASKFVIQPYDAATGLEVRIYGGTGTAKVSTRYGSLPLNQSQGLNISLNYFTDKLPSRNEPLYVVIKPHQAQNSFYVKIWFTFPPLITDGNPVGNISSSQTQVTFRFELNKPAFRIKFLTYGGPGDGDLYIKHNQMVSRSNYDQNSMAYSNDESITLNNPAQGTYYIGIVPYSAFSGMTLAVQVTYQQPNTNAPNTGNPWTNRPYTNYPYTNGPYTNGPYTNGPYTNGPYTNGPYTNSPTGSPTYDLSCGNTYSPPSTSQYASLYGRVYLPLDTVELKFHSYNGTGDVDLYARAGARPSKDNGLYDHKSERYGNIDEILISNPRSSSSIWYVQMYAYNSFSGVKFFVGCQGGNPSTNPPLPPSPFPTNGPYTNGPFTNGPYTNIFPTTGPRIYQLSCDMYRAYSPPGMPTGASLFGWVYLQTAVTELKFALFGGSGDADLYVRAGAPPSKTNGLYDYKSEAAGNNDQIVVSDPRATSSFWYVEIYAYSSFSGLNFTVDCESPNPTTNPPPPPPPTTNPPNNITELTMGSPVTISSGARLSYKHFFFKAQIQGNIKVKLTGLSGTSGDCDLYVQKNRKALRTDYKYRSEKFGNREEITFQVDLNEWWYVSAYGYSSYTNVELEVNDLQSPALGGPIEHPNPDKQKRDSVKKIKNKRDQVKRGNKIKIEKRSAKWIMKKRKE